MNPKTLQYLMEHSDIGVTLNTYTHFKHEDGLKSRRLGNENGICTPIVPLFCKTVGLSTGQVDYYKNVKFVDKLQSKWYTIPILRIKT